MRLPLIFARQADAQAADGPDASVIEASDSSDLDQGSKTPGGSSRTTGRPPAKGGFAREAAAVLLIASALYTALALWSFQGDPLRPQIQGEDWVGPVGAAVASALVGYLGVVAWLIPVELVLIALPLLRGQASVARPARFAGDLVVAIIAAALAHVSSPEARAFGEMPFGGAMGEVSGEILRALFSTVGSFIIGFTVIALILVGRASFSVVAVAGRVSTWFAVAWGSIGSGVQSLSAAWRKAREIDDRGEPTEGTPAPKIALQEADAIIAALVEDVDEVPSSDALSKGESPAPERPAPEVSTRAVVDPTAQRPDDPVEAKTALEMLADVPTPSPIMPVAKTGPKKARRNAAPPQEEEPAPKEKKAKRTKVDAGPKIVDTSGAQKTLKADKRSATGLTGDFKLPSSDMLAVPEGGPMIVDEAKLTATAQLLEKTLADYGVSGKVEEIHPGPTVTTFEVSPAAGTKVSKVAGLADDLALGLSVKVRIIAPIPGKNRIGFEIPNERRIPVNLRELTEDRRFTDMKSPLPCVMGRDIVGAPYFADLASMPHMIVAGATGAGKSVGLNVILVSLLMRKTPDELRLLMVDPKVVELAPFDGIPHMLLPVVTDMKQAANALKWAVDEMERRYQLFANAGTKNITTYNGWVDRVRAGEAKMPKSPAKVTAIAPDGSDVEIAAAKDGSDVEMPERIPFIVIVIDEFADLMMQQGKDVEASVARLAQKARAAGMHVILATQRPSVDVITGMIKANFPTRVAFRVAQKVDSRTILDEQGAEHLLGRGDMLIKMNGSNETRRVQCPFCSEEEVLQVCDFLRAQGTPVYDESILKPRDEDGEAPEPGDAEADPMYDQAVRIVAETRRCSTSWLQRKLGIGYNRAAKIVETMERRGIIGPANGAKDREILIESF